MLLPAFSEKKGGGRGKKEGKEKKTLNIITWVFFCIFLLNQ